MSNRTDIVVETDNAEGQVLLSASRVYDLTEDKTQDTINSEVENSLSQLNKEMAGVVDGNISTAAIAKDNMVIVKNSTISGLADGLYFARKAIPANQPLDSTYFGGGGILGVGGLNFLLSKVIPKFYTVPANSSLTIQSPNLPNAYLCIGYGQGTAALCAAIGIGYGATSDRHKINTLIESTRITFSASDSVYGLTITNTDTIYHNFYMIDLLPNTNN